MCKVCCASSAAILEVVTCGISWYGFIVLSDTATQRTNYCSYRRERVISVVKVTWIVVVIERLHTPKIIVVFVHVEILIGLGVGRVTTTSRLETKWIASVQRWISTTPKMDSLAIAA